MYSRAPLQLEEGGILFYSLTKGEGSPRLEGLRSSWLFAKKMFTALRRKGYLPGKADPSRGEQNRMVGMVESAPGAMTK